MCTGEDFFGTIKTRAGLRWESISCILVIRDLRSEPRVITLGAVAYVFIDLIKSKFWRN
jgi:hypothetical protein